MPKKKKVTVPVGLIPEIEHMHDYATIFKRLPMILANVHQSKTVCEIAMKQCYLCYEYITNKTHEINEMFVLLYPRHIDMIKETCSDELVYLQKLAMKRDKQAFVFMSKQNEEICRYAFEMNPSNYAYILDIDLKKDLAWEAIRRFPRNVVHVPGDPKDFIDYAISIDPKAIKHDADQNESTCWDVLGRDPTCLGVIRPSNRTKAMCIYCVDRDPSMIKNVPVSMIDYTMAYQSVKGYSAALKHIPLELIDDGLCELAIDNHCTSFRHIPEEKCTETLCTRALYRYEDRINKLINLIPEHMIDVLLLAIELSRGLCIKAIRDPTSEMMILAASFCD